MKFFSATYTIWQRELIRYTRDRGRMFTTLFQPLMFLTIFGLGFRRVFAGSDLGVDYILFMFPGIVAMNVMGTAFFSSISTVWDKEFGFLKEILVAPIPRSAIAVGKASGAATIAALQAFLLFAIAPFVGIHLTAIMVPQLFFFMLLIAFTIAGIGLLIAATVKTIENFGIYMNVLVFPMFFLSGAFFPLTSVPQWMALLSRLNPLSYAVDALRQILLSLEVGPRTLQHFTLRPAFEDALSLAGFAAVMMGAAILAFRKTE